VAIVDPLRGNTTTLTSPADLAMATTVRDALLKTPMEHGVAASYDRLAELLASLRAQGMEKGARES
jgi:hypothetical protein